MGIEEARVSSLGDLTKWLLDSGASSHFTPFLSNLKNAFKLLPPLNIKVADGTHLKATHQGETIINFIADEGMEVDLRLLRVLYVPGLQTRLFSIESFTSDGKTSANYSNGQVKLIFGKGTSITIDLPHLPPASFRSQHATPVYTMCGNSDPPAEDLEDLSNRKVEPVKKRMDVHLAHRIFGHKSIPALLNASNHDVWDDTTLFFGGDTWCDSCKIAVSHKQARSKTPMNINGKPLEHIFVDLVPIPEVLCGVPECRDKNFLFICDPLSKYVDKVNVENKSTEETIAKLNSWRQSMKNNGYPIFLYLRSDAGTNFTSDDFKKWCEKENITLTIAGPKHQEQNGFVEAAYKTANEMA